MIRTIDLTLNAAHPELPLPEAVAFAGSPSAVFIRGIPRRRGSWTIDAIRVVATYPDGTAATRSAVESPDNVWTATIPGTATSGRTVQGFRVVADGTDEHGEPVTNYVLGFADLAIVSLGVAPSPAPGETAAQVWYFDSEPDPPRKGDIYKAGGVYMIYNGEEWEAFGSGTINYNKLINKPEIGGVTLYGNKTLDDLGIQSKLSAQQLENIAAVPGKQDALSAQQLANIAAVPGKANKVQSVTVGNLAGLDANGDITDSGIPAAAVPTGASAFNKLATESFVNSSIATNTATFRGTFNLVSELGLSTSATHEAVATAIATYLATETPPVVPENNDYCFVQVPTSDATPTEISRVDRYKCTVEEIGSTISRTWDYEFSLNNSSFTAAQWAAINSGITAQDVSKLAGIAAGAEVNAIETIKVNGVAQTPDQARAVDIPVPSVVTPSAQATAGQAASALATWTQLAAKADAAALRYDIGTVQAINTASQDSSGGTIIYYGEATLADRTANRVVVSAELNELRVAFPAATNSEKVRDFELRITLQAAASDLAAPGLVIVPPTGETVTIENPDDAIPTIEGATAGTTATTLLYFSETAPGVFLCKGEAVQEVAQ